MQGDVLRDKKKTILFGKGSLCQKIKTAHDKIRRPDFFICGEQSELQDIQKKSQNPADINSHSAGKKHNNSSQQPSHRPALSPHQSYNRAIRLNNHKDNDCAYDNADKRKKNMVHDGSSFLYFCFIICQKTAPSGAVLSYDAAHDAMNITISRPQTIPAYATPEIIKPIRPCMIHFLLPTHPATIMTTEITNAPIQTQRPTV